MNILDINLLTLDIEDVDRVSKYTWYINRDKDRIHSTIYDRDLKEVLNINIGVFVLGFLRSDFGKVVDHKDRNIFNNKKDNLRIITEVQSMMNRGKFHPETATSKYKCVYWNKKSKVWEVNVQARHRRKYGGGFKNEIEAALKANELMKLMHGEFAVLNNVPSPTNP